MVDALQDPGAVVIPGRTGRDFAPGRRAHPQSERGIVKQVLDGIGERADLGSRNHETILAVIDQLSRPTLAGHYDRQAAGHRLHRHQRVGIFDGRQDEDVGVLSSAGDEPPKRDLVLKEGDNGWKPKHLSTAVMGGHTPGSVSYEFTTHENGKAYKSFVMGGPGGAANLEGAQQFLESATRLNKFLDIQVAVNVHSWLNGYHYPNGGILERRDRLAMRKPGDPNPFIDNASWRQWVKMAQDGARKAVDDEKAKAATAKTQ